MTICDDCGSETDCYKVLDFGEICCKTCYDSYKDSFEPSFKSQNNSQQTKPERDNNSNRSLDESSHVGSLKDKTADTSQLTSKENLK